MNHPCHFVVSDILVTALRKVSTNAVLSTDKISELLALPQEVKGPCWQAQELEPRTRMVGTTLILTSFLLYSACHPSTYILSPLLLPLQNTCTTKTTCVDKNTVLGFQA